MSNSTTPGYASAQVAAPRAGRLAHLLAWIHAQQRAILLAAAAFQLLVLVAMIVTPATTLVTGETVLVRVQPLDPRDLFRGDYVILSYQFSRFDPARLAPDAKDLATIDATTNVGRPIYALLTKDADGLHDIVQSFSFEQPGQGPYLAGTLQPWGRIEYGIESFFVQEGTGHAYEDAVRNGGLSAEMTVDSEGHAVLTRLVVE